LQVPVIARDLDAGTITYSNEAGAKVEVEITGGKCKLQWKADWAMRWFALDVDYEMSGKDLIESVRLSSKICRVLGARPPESFTYELFLDENGEKISKSRGNGLSIEEWLRYAAPESLSLYMFQQPRRAKRLYFDVIPRAADDYLRFLNSYSEQDEAEKLANPAWHIHAGQPPREDAPVTFALLMNLAGACNSENREVLWGFISRYAPGATAANHPMLDALVGYAINYYRDFVKPQKSYRPPNDQERAAMEDLLVALEAMDPAFSGTDIQNQVYEIGKAHKFENLRDWFKALYEVLFGQSQGPRFGSFAALYGVAETAVLVRRALAGDDLAAD
jgi:lysyl-tRNA synthetase class 1